MMIDKPWSPGGGGGITPGGGTGTIDAWPGIKGDAGSLIISPDPIQI